MPEGDTVWRTATRLDQALAGREIVESDLRWPGEIATADLTGRTTLEVVSRGKHVLHRVEGGLTLHSHLRMEGQWRVEATAGLPARWRRNPQLRALVAAPDWTALGLRLGMLDLVPTAHEGDLVGHLGPDVLGPDWDLARAVDNVAGARVPVGQALLDQRNLAGVGTMWCAETLFLERVPPWSRADELGRETVERVVARAHRLIDNGRRHAVQSSTGSQRLDEAHYVHARSGRPCRRCGATVRVAMIGEPTRERTMFYCPGCQGGLGPTDDGRPQAPLGSNRGAARSRRSY
ncbi:DNA glycosylase [Terrabacter sp. Root85]|uniref:DNA-formamidopyrimidine glycosylase family protein n=1 Tax=unclassified Terrabacter TaxID=2630222 RepID=UPI0006F84D41|nr:MULTISPECIES: DNA-formamidopyrimidine glycosylase family protein [unclassified Terrabacter]KRC84426.1 DNA glycosylase [Terrabacter sp. Root85]KRF44321.1 DNA glycosylase [Terrabacter sp. Soil811]